MWGLNSWPWDQESQAPPTEPVNCPSFFFFKLKVGDRLEIEMWVILSSSEQGFEHAGGKELVKRDKLKKRIISAAPQNVSISL